MRKLYDLLTVTPLIAWYSLALWLMIPALADQIALVRLFIETDASVLPASLVLSILSKTFSTVFFALLVLIFIIRHSALPYPIPFHSRVAAGAGTFLGVGILVLPPVELNSSVYVTSLVLTISGTGLAIWALLSLSRSMSIMPQARRLVTAGPYALIRHPLYVGEFIALTGVALQYLMPWALILVAIQTAFQFQRIKNEEKVLTTVFSGYWDYKKRTRRLLPGIY
jgi:protein-S-isoprenylcysteine O-methyltransferase Ste14